MSLIDDFENLEDDPDYKVERVTLDFVTLLSRYMEENNCNQSQLAERLNMSGAAISKLLKGNKNISIKRMTKIAHKLGFNISIARQYDNSMNIPINEKLLKKLAENYNQRENKEQNITDYLSEIINKKLSHILSEDAKNSLDSNQSSSQWLTRVDRTGKEKKTNSSSHLRNVQ